MNNNAGRTPIGQVRPLAEAEREQIAARYNVTLVPERVTICPPRTFSRDALEGHGWRQQNRARCVAMRRRKAFDRPVYADLAARMTLQEMADHLGCSVMTVRRALADYGLTAIPTRTLLPRDAILAAASTMSVGEIADRLDVAPTSVRRVLSRAGVKAVPATEAQRMTVPITESPPPGIVHAIKRIKAGRKVVGDEAASAWAWMAERMTTSQIAETLGRADSSVRRSLAHHDLKALPAWGGNRRDDGADGGRA